MPFVDRPSEDRTPTVISELAVRRGVGRDTDVGLELFSIGAAASVRHRLVQGRWQWALLGAAAWGRSEEGSGRTAAVLGQLRLGAVATRRTSARWAFSVGPIVTGAVMAFAGGAEATGVLAGGVANAQWTFGGARRWHLIPELSRAETTKAAVSLEKRPLAASERGEGRRTRTFNQRIKSPMLYH